MKQTPIPQQKAILFMKDESKEKGPPKHPAVIAMFSELLSRTGLNSAGLAEKIGVTPQGISNYMTGRNEPGRKMIAAMIKAFPHINAAWLANGEGDPFPYGVHGEKHKPVAPVSAPDAPPVTPITKSEAAATPPVEADKASRVAEAQPDYTSGPSTVAEAENILLKEQVADLKADKARLLDENGELRETNKKLLGKSFPSSDAADDDEATDPTAPAGPLPQPMLSVQHRRRAGFRQQGVSLD